MKVGEVEEGLHRAPLLAHEQQRWHRREQEDGGEAGAPTLVGEAREPLAESAVADLVVVLDEVDEAGRRQVARRLAAKLAVAKRRGLALVDEAGGQRAGELVGGCRGVVGVVALGVAGHEMLGDMVEVVVPLRVVAHGMAVRSARKVAGLVGVVLENEMHVAPGLQLGADETRDLGQDVRPARVGDGVHGIEAQAVDAEDLQPVEHVLGEEAPDLGPAEVDRLAPRRVPVVGEEVRRVGAEEVPLGTEVVVDDVEKDHQPAAVRGVDETGEGLGAAVGTVGREVEHPVIAPVTGAGEVGERHELDRGDAERRQMVELGLDPGEVARRREGADVQLVQHRLVPGPAPPVRGGEREAVGVDHLARSERVEGLVARGRIGHLKAADGEEIARACAGALDPERVPALALGAHGDRALGDAARVEHEADLGGRRRPEAKADGVLLDDGPEAVAPIRHHEPPLRRSSTSERLPTS